MVDTGALMAGFTEVVDCPLARSAAVATAGIAAKPRDIQNTKFMANRER